MRQAIWHTSLGKSSRVKQILPLRCQFETPRDTHLFPDSHHKHIKNDSSNSSKCSCKQLSTSNLSLLVMF